jgi:hypothetical protein
VHDDPFDDCDLAFLVVLTVVTSFAHVLELPAKMRLTRDQ